MGLGPVDVHKQADADDLPELKVEATPAAAPARAPAPAPAAPAAAPDGEPAQ